jgi:hypothetical protein
VVLALVIPLLAGWATPDRARPGLLRRLERTLRPRRRRGRGLRPARPGRRRPDSADRRRRSRSAGRALASRQSILVTGATGLIGRRLVAALVGAGHEVIALTRDRATAADLPAPIRIVTALDQIADDTRSTRSSTWPASRSPTACGPPPSAAGSSARAWP